MRRTRSSLGSARFAVARRLARRGAVAASAVALGAALFGVGSTHASAYGPDHLFEITLSENCVNPTACVASTDNPFGIGGIWGWIEPDQGGTADTQVTFQGHSNANTALNGTTHLPSSWNWVEVSLPPPSPFVSPTDPNGNYFFFTIPSFPGFEFLTPATPGRYRVSFGPGVSSNVTVTQLH